MSYDTSLTWMEDYIKFLITPIHTTKVSIGLDELKYNLAIVGKKKVKLYYLKFMIPYAKQFITLEMYLNPLYPELGPDLILNEEEDIQQTSFKDFADSLKSLSCWNLTNEFSILQLLSEFIEHYKKHQLSILKSHTEIRLDPEVLFNTIPLDNFEINLIQGAKQLEAKFLTKFKLDLSAALNLPENTKVVEALLYISFGGNSYNRIIPELYLPGYLTKLFDGSESLHIPPFVEVQRIAEYIDKVKECVLEKARYIFISIDKRKQFIATLLAIQPLTVLEYDVLNYRKATLLLELSDVHFLLNFDLPINFPTKQFTMTMHSVHHMTDQGKPVVRVVNNFPYSPRWEPKQMIMKAISYIIENEFKKFNEASFKNFC